MPLKGKFAYLPNGKKVELFPVGVLATAVGRTSQAIRKWEVAGIIPPSFFKDKSGKRLIRALNGTTSWWRGAGVALQISTHQWPLRRLSC